MYFYESHLGGIYTSNKKYSYDDLYCDECGDSDWYIGEYDSWEDYIKDIDAENFIYSLEYLSEESGLSVARILELNPKLGEDFDE